jgi:lysophospholipase L1-like esterase
MTINNISKIGRIMSFAATAAMLSTTTALKAGEILAKDNDKIAFMGDSITQGGAQPGGYVTLVMSGLEAVGVKATSIPVGISGHKSNQMLARLEKDVLSKKPEWMTLSCGVNDVWHGARGVVLEDYKKNITEIVDLCKKADIKVMILTSTMIQEDPAGDMNQKLKPYNDFLIELAKEKNLPLADLNADMQAAIKASEDKKGGKLLTSDGVHMNPDGNKMMAVGVLKAFGLDEKQIEKAQAEWAKPPKK